MLSGRNVCNNINKYVIAVYMLSLILACKMKHLKAVFLLKIVEWHNEEYKTYIKKELLTKNTHKILFPNSLEQLKILLKNE
jgi:hypothetical protein